MQSLRRPTRVLDLGTGTGILAIAAAKLFRVPVLAADNDPIAVATARANAATNGVAALVRAVESEGLRSPALRGRFDLVLANILARPLASLASALAAHLSPRGSLVLSGCLSEQEALVLSAYRAQRLFLRRRLVDDGWVTLVLAR